MALTTKKKFEGLIEHCLAKFCDKKISDTMENIDPEGYNKVRTVIWYYKPYTFTASYLFGGSKDCPNFMPLGITTRLDGVTQEEKLGTGQALIDTLAKANLMREAGIFYREYHQSSLAKDK